MSNKIILKKSSVPDKVPTTTDLAYGELAINYADEKIYFKNSLNDIKYLSGGVTASDSFKYISIGGQDTVVADTATDTLTLIASTGISITTNAAADSITLINSAPDQVVSLTGSGATSITGTYPNFTIASTGTVTSVAALSIGTAGTDVTSTVATGTTTPVITLNIPTASAVNRGALSAADWTTFNNKTSNTGTVTSVSGTGTVSGLSLSGTVTTTGNITLGGTLAVTASNFASQIQKTFLAAPNSVDGTPTFRTIVASDIPTLNQSTTGSAATLTTGRTIALTGDVTYTSGSFNGSANVTGAATLASVGTAGTYTKVTTDAKGRVTSGTTLVATDIPSLDASKITTGTIDAARLPSYVDDVIEGANLAAFPATGETGKIYVALDTNKTYRWSGSAYVYITSGAVDSVGGYTGVVTAANLLASLLTVDGTGSGLDADLLDGNSASAFYLATNPSGYTTNTGTVTGVTGTAPIISSGGTAPAISISAATTVAAGSMSAADKTKLDGIATGATANTGTVTSVGGTGTVSGLSLSGTVTTTGNLTLGGTLAVTASNFASQTANTVLAAPDASAGVPTFRALTLLDLPDAWVKKAVGCATTAALTINTAQTTIDGVTLTATTRVLVKNQAAPAQNGIYTNVTTTTWTRTPDADTASEIAGAYVNVDAGTVNGGKVFDNDFKSTDTLGTTAINWSQNVDTGYFTTVGNSFAILTNPSAITFPRINADNTVSTLDAATFRTAIGAGTVTSVAALTIGTTGTDIGSTVATGTTTPVITLNIPTASATNRGALSAADWTTFNNKTSNTGTVTSVGGTGTVAGLTLTGTVTTTGNLTLGGTLSTPVSTINDSTTVGQNLVKLTNPSATTFLRVNADNTVSALSASTFRSAIGGSTLGRNIFTITNPSAVTFPRFNADNTVTALDAASFRTAIGAAETAGLDFRSYVATAAQTTFNVTYTAPYVTVIVNGAVLDPADYTAISGTSVILSSSCAAGDVVLVQGFQSVSIGVGGSSVDLSSVAQNIVPSTNITYNLGSSTNRWKDLFLSGSTIDLGGALIKADATSGSVALIPAPTIAEPNPTGVLVSPIGGLSAVATTGGVVSAQNFADAVANSTFANNIGARGGGSNRVFYENDQTVTTSYTITSGKSALSAGPITIATGATVTIPTGSRWVIV